MERKEQQEKLKQVEKRGAEKPQQLIDPFDPKQSTSTKPMKKKKEKKMMMSLDEFWKTEFKGGGGSSGGGGGGFSYGIFT